MNYSKYLLKFFKKFTKSNGYYKFDIVSVEKDDGFYYLNVIVSTDTEIFSYSVDGIIVWLQQYEETILDILGEIDGVIDYRIFINDYENPAIDEVYISEKDLDKINEFLEIIKIPQSIENQNLRLTFDISYSLDKKPYTYYKGSASIDFNLLDSIDNLKLNGRHVHLNPKYKLTIRELFTEFLEYYDEGEAPNIADQLYIMLANKLNLNNTNMYFTVGTRLGTIDGMNIKNDNNWNVKDTSLKSEFFI